MTTVAGSSIKRRTLPFPADRALPGTAQARPLSVRAAHPISRRVRPLAIRGWLLRRHLVTAGRPSGEGKALARAAAGIYPRRGDRRPTMAKGSLTLRTARRGSIRRGDALGKERTQHAGCGIS